jgi:GMP synthase PP-ATPase subunit
MIKFGKLDNLLPANSVGVGDDERTYEKAALRAVDQLTEHCGLGTFTYDF